MKALKKGLTVLLMIAVILAAVFLAGRYGWKLGGFRACQGAGITSVEVGEEAVRITGFYPGSFPEGFCGCYARELDGKLYVGFRFSAVFGFFETGDFAVTIPVKGEITEVVLKTNLGETSVWNARTAFSSHIRFDTLSAYSGSADDMTVREMPESTARKNDPQTDIKGRLEHCVLPGGSLRRFLLCRKL